ncbi:hypothetical protein PRZ48_011981 [Zasmidium cellare]|uniref:Uncharacterized protein n=1 Tax=Zasmidium cellare TaxID=395010 RepID=A0ABR0E8G6_ZASCE|nr:hypothetical protein PRZ48_011981 [Zasmidium cellare]
MVTYIKKILTPELFLAVFNHRHPWSKGALPDGATVGPYHFKPSNEYMQTFYDLTFHQALLPLSKIPLAELLDYDFTQLLPPPTASDYPQQALGLITILDQQRGLCSGYGFRYTRSFFDPICEKLARQLTALPADVRPDGKHAWLSRGWTFDEWIVNVVWFWAPLVHADAFMTQDRQHLKDHLHFMRAEVEAHTGQTDPFASLEASDDVDIHAFERIESEGPPKRGYFTPGPATCCDYAFWWIRILNSHFAITDMCGHYPYWIRWKGLLFSEADKEFLRQTRFRYDPDDEPVLQQVREDYLEGVWRDLPVNDEYER